MADSYMDLFNKYVMGCAQMLTGFYFMTRLLQKRGKFYAYLLFACCGIIVLIHFFPNHRIGEFGAYMLLLVAIGIFLYRADWRSVTLYAALAVEVMHLCYGITDSLLSLLYPMVSCFNQEMAGVAFMILGNMALVFTLLCCRVIYRYFLNDETTKKQYVAMILIPILMIFFMGEYISTSIYGSPNVIDDERTAASINHGQVFVIQMLGLAGLFCILFAYKKLLQNFYLNMELSLLEQEERFLNQYVEEAKADYEKTKSFRHDVKNHITVVKELLQNKKWEQALNYIGDMEDMAEKLSFPCSTNNPVVDILAGNKLGIAKSMGIDVCCTLFLPYPCGLRDIDICIILSNALDNAIHACKNMDDSAEKYIRVTGHIQGDFILIEIENSFQGNGLPRERTGLSNIRATAEKYQGAMNIKTQGKVFLLSVLLIIPQGEDTLPAEGAAH